MRSLLLLMLLCMAICSPVFAGHSDLEESYTEILQSVEKQTINAYVGGLDTLEKQMIAADRPPELLDVRAEKDRFKRDGDIAIGLANQSRPIVALARGVLAARRERQEALIEAYLHLLEGRIEELSRQSRIQEAAAAEERLETIRVTLLDLKSGPNASPPKTTPSDGSGGPAIGTNWTVADVGMEFVWIPQMKIWVGKYEVTNGEYRKKEPGYDSKEFREHPLNGDRQPVVSVSFDDAKAYAEWLAEREKKADRLPAGWQYRLPTDAEWQTFAQCGDDREYPWGNTWKPKYGNYADQTLKRLSPGWQGIISGYDDGFTVTCPVEKSGKNEWGLYGVGGNVWEYCLKDDTDTSGTLRGASWRPYRPGSMRVGNRWSIDGSSRNDDRGFRLVLAGL